MHLCVSVRAPESLLILGGVCTAEQLMFSKATRDNVVDQNFPILHFGYSYPKTGRVGNVTRKQTKENRRICFSGKITLTQGEYVRFG